MKEGLNNTGSVHPLVQPYVAARIAIEGMHTTVPVRGLPLHSRVVVQCVKVGERDTVRLFAVAAPVLLLLLLLLQSHSFAPRHGAALLDALHHQSRRRERHKVWEIE